MAAAGGTAPTTPQETLGITREAYESLSERAKHFFRLEPVAE